MGKPKHLERTMLHCSQKQNCEVCNVVLLTYFDKMKKEKNTLTPNRKVINIVHKERLGNEFASYTIAKGTPIISHK